MHQVEVARRGVASETAVASAVPSGRHRRRVPLLVALCFVMAAAPFVGEYTAQPASRYALTAAVVDDGTLRLDHYVGVLGIDRAEFDGHTYSDKAPGQPLLAVPFYAVGRAVGVEPATHLRVNGNLGLWWVTLWTSIVPAALLIAAVGRRVGRLVPQGATFAGLALAFGTMLLPFSVNLYGHVLSTALDWGAWAVVSDRPRDLRRAAIAGALAGAAVLVEYPLVVVVVAVAGYLAIRRAWASLAVYAAAGVPAAVLLGLYQVAAFGSPFSDTYSTKQGRSGHPLVTGMPNPVRLFEILFGTRGLFLFTPIVAAGVVGLVVLARRDGDGNQGLGTARPEAVMGLVVTGAYLLFASGWPNAWGGDGPGPRYVIPVLPFLAVGIAEAYRRRPHFARWLLGLSVVSMGLSGVTAHLVGSGAPLIGASVRNWLDGVTTPTIFTLALGGAGWIIHGVVTAGAFAALHRTHRRL